MAKLCRSAWGEEPPRSPVAGRCRWATRRIVRAVSRPPFGLVNTGRAPSGPGPAGIPRSAKVASNASSDLAVSGTLAWLVAKLVKAQVARERPAELLEDVIVHGGEATGLGFPSGHAAVSAALATAASPYLPREARLATWVVAGIVSFSRVYVGAHLPIDIVGGVPLGVAAGTAVQLVFGVLSRSGSPPADF